ncbi:MAG: glycogen/starch synthase [Promethearchaeota archaeon]
MYSKIEYKTVVFVSFENHYAPCGGLSAVMKMLPPIMSKSIKTVLLSPLFFNIEKTKKALESRILVETDLKGNVLYAGKNHPINLYKSTEFSEFKNYSIFLIKSERFFLAGENPYIDTWRENALFHDSYFFSKSIPIALGLIKDEFNPPYILNLQDWETALVADVMPSTLPNKCVLTLHNPYDEDLPNDPQGRTILQYVIPKLHGLSTVSEHYSYELQNDVLQRDILARKLKGQFQYLNPIGINNGNFVELSFPENISNSEEIISEKLKNRRAFNNLLAHQEELNPTWGEKIDLMKGDRPIFLLFGRDDPKQKGFDVAAAAIYRLLKKRGKNLAIFIFTLIPDRYGLINLAYLKDLALEFSKNVMIFPFRLSAGYAELQKASNFIIMPSYYEPFGAANEGYASGVPVIARATGGFVQQVCPENFEALPESIKKYLKWYHKDIIKSTGYLYREHPSTETPDNWRYLFGTDFTKPRSIQEPVDWRNPIFWSMVSELEKVIEEAIMLYNNNKKKYCEMILNGIKLFKKFTWEKSAKKYKNLLYHI